MQKTKPAAGTWLPIEQAPKDKPILIEFGHGYTVAQYDGWDWSDTTGTQKYKPFAFAYIYSPETKR